MKTIHKEFLAACNVNLPRVVQVLMPVAATVVRVDRQHSDICVWFETPVQESLSETRVSGRVFVLTPTGGVVEDDATYVGTVALLEGAYQVHVFELSARPEVAGG